MKTGALVKLPQEWIVDYQPARDRAIRWLGERYLLARDVKRLTAAEESSRGGRAARHPAASTASHPQDQTRPTR